MRTITVLLATIFSLSAYCATQNGVNFDDSIKIEGKTLILNGLGTRKATWFNVKVYVGALYLEKKASSSKEFLSNQMTKQIQMTFVRDVAAKKIKAAWSEALEKRENYNKIKEAVEKFNSYMPEVKEKMNFKITFFPNKVVTEIDGKKMEDIMNSDFSKTLLSVWFVDPIDDGLREGLLSL